MNFKTLYILFLVAITGFQCSSDPEKQQQKNTTEKRLFSSIKNIEFEILSEQGANGLKIKNIRFDTSKLYNETKGIMVTFSIEAEKNAFDSIAMKGFNSYFIDLKCNSDEGKSFCHRDEVFKDADKKKFLHINRDFFISQPAMRTLEVSFPYRLMEMKEGDHEMTVDISAYPAKFVSDTTSLDVRMLDNISSDPQSSIKVMVRVKAPKLYKTSLTVHSIKLNTKNVRVDKYDVGIIGLPDLFWEVYCGNDYLYYSPVLKNKTEYPIKYSTPEFYCTKDDIINLAVVDYDNGPFNTQDDIVDKWSIRASNLPKNKIDTLRFGKLEYMVVETRVE